MICRHRRPIWCSHVCSQRRALEAERAATAAEYAALADEVAELQRKLATQKEASVQQRAAFIATCQSLEQDIRCVV